MEVTATFKWTPGELVDVPHLCIDGGLVKLAYLGRSGGKGYLIETVTMGKPFTVEVFESCVCAPREDE
jgi:hypothetical protein